MSSHQFKTLAASRLRDISTSDKKAFKNWLASHRSSKSSRQTDLPSSQLPPKASLILIDAPQLFIIIDTCSIVEYRIQFMDYVTRLNDLFDGPRCPVRFIISLAVLEELDKFNRRPSRKKRKKIVKEESTSGDIINSRHLESAKDIVLGDLLSMTRQVELNSSPTLLNRSQDPPRMFARFIEEEMRVGHRLIGELDPHKELPLLSKEIKFEIVNKDDRILDCCLRTRAFIKSNPHHPETAVILVSEDNLFKSKATTFGIASFRWIEFDKKYKNFGLRHYISTPLLPGQSGSRSSFPPFPRLGSMLKASKENDEDGVVILEEVINIE